MTYSDAWFDRQLQHCRECLAVAERTHTPEELAVARAALDAPAQPKQPELTLRLNA